MTPEQEDLMEIRMRLATIESYLAQEETGFNPFKKTEETYYKLTLPEALLKIQDLYEEIRVLKNERDKSDAENTRILNNPYRFTLSQLRNEVEEKTQELQKENRKIKYENETLRRMIFKLQEDVEKMFKTETQ